jgi:hypothetical protein
MINKISFGAAFLFAGALLTGCKKDGDTPTVSRALLIGTYKLTSEHYSPSLDLDGDGDKESEAYPLLDECEKDNRVTFHEDGTGVLNEGDSKCDPDDDQTSSFTWELGSDNILTVNESGEDATSNEVLKADGNTLKFSDTFTEDDKTYTVTLTFTKLQ